jgi:hypothetical protein
MTDKPLTHLELILNHFDPEEKPPTNRPKGEPLPATVEELMRRRRRLPHEARSR